MTTNCPVCAAPIEAGAGVCLACGRASQPVPEGPVLASRSDAPVKVSDDARRDERFEIPTDVVLRKVGPGGATEKEERTIAHDLSRSGMRIFTSWPDLEAGDQVEVQEVGGSFATGAVVRHVKRGTDRITRVGVEFVGTRAPDRLVGTTTGLARPAFTPPLRAPGPDADVPIPPAATGGSRPSSRTRTSGSTPRPRNSASTPRPRNSGSTPRPRTTTAIPRPQAPAHPTSSSPRPGEGEPSGAPAAPARSAESILEEIATVRATARTLVGESKVWEALERLVVAQALADGTGEAQAIKIQILETQAQVPSLMRAAQQNLEDLARSEPLDPAVHSALGRIFWQAGLSARARVAFNRVLVLDPSNSEAAAALAALNDPTKRR